MANSSDKSYSANSGDAGQSVSHCQETHENRTILEPVDGPVDTAFQVTPQATASAVGFPTGTCATPARAYSRTATFR